MRKWYVTLGIVAAAFLMSVCYRPVRAQSGPWCVNITYRAALTGNPFTIGLNGVQYEFKSQAESAALQATQTTLHSGDFFIPVGQILQARVVEASQCVPAP